MAKILFINSSPRKRSNSRTLAAKVAEGAARKGHSPKTIEIGRAKIQPCIGCEACQADNGRCVIKDDMVGIYPDFKEADIIIFSSPIYFFTINGQMKVFLDRTFAAGAAYKGKRIGGVFTYGDVDPVRSGCINAIRTFQDLCASEYTGAKWIGAVYGTLMEQGAADDAPDLLKAAEEFGESLE